MYFNKANPCTVQGNTCVHSLWLWCPSSAQAQSKVCAREGHLSKDAIWLSDQNLLCLLWVTGDLWPRGCCPAMCELPGIAHFCLKPFLTCHPLPQRPCRSVCYIFLSLSWVLTSFHHFFSLDWILKHLFRSIFSFVNFSSSESGSVK